MIEMKNKQLLTLFPGPLTWLGSSKLLLDASIQNAFRGSESVLRADPLTIFGYNILRLTKITHNTIKVISTYK